MKVALLDVNVLIALIDPEHKTHDAAHSWFDLNRQSGWATCPITENACLRILGKPGYPYLGLSIPDIREILSELCGSGGHQFWPDSVSLLHQTRFDLTGTGPKNLTDLYLAGLAVEHAGRLATFDKNVRWQNVAGAGSDDVHVIAS